MGAALRVVAVHSSQGGSGDFPPLTCKTGEFLVIVDADSFPLNWNLKDIPWVTCGERMYQVMSAWPWALQGGHGGWSMRLGFMVGQTLRPEIEAHLELYSVKKYLNTMRLILATSELKERNHGRYSREEREVLIEYFKRGSALMGLDSQEAMAEEFATDQVAEWLNAQMPKPAVMNQILQKICNDLALALPGREPGPTQWERLLGEGL